VELNGDPSATTVITAADDLAKSINLGSNSINLYGTTYTGATFWASSNGLITFGTGNSAFINGDLKSSPTQAAISPFWTDLVKSSMQATASGPMLLAKIDTVHSCLIVEWNQVTDQNNTTIPITFEAIIQLNTGATPGNIVFNYLQLDSQFKAQSSVGIKAAGVQGPNCLVVSFNQMNSLIDVNKVITFTWQSPVQIPVISSLGTNSASEGSPALTLTVNGSNFANTSFIQFGSTALTTSFINTSLLQATIPVSLLAEEGSFNVKVVTPGSSGGTSNAVPFSVTDATLTPSGQFLSGTEGQTLTSGLVATFTDPGTDGTAADYSATVTWDDGNGQSHSSTGTVQLVSGTTFAVYADNSVAYAEEGTYAVTVSISDKGGSQTSVGSEVMVADAALAASGASISGTEGTPFSGIVATFTDADPNGVLAEYTATIKWGDGESSTGAITNGSSGGFVVSGSHTYLEEGNYAVSVVIADAGGASTTIADSAALADAALTAASATSISGTEGTAFSGVLATFTDADPNGTLGDYTATIDWGDGQTSTATIGVGTSGGFVVSGSHTYSEEGNFTASVVIADAGGASATAGISAAIADSALTAQGTSFSSAEGTAFLGTVASFTDADPNGAPGDYTATINWGDGQTSTGTITSGPAGNFLVSGNHAYMEEGSYTVSVAIADAGGASTTAGSSAAVADAALTAQGTSISGTEAAAFSGTVATFTDADPNGALGDYSATINWGDGQTSTGTIAIGTGGAFAVSGSHSYLEEGIFGVSVAIMDSGGASATVGSSAAIVEAAFTAQGTSISGTEGAAFSGTVATFSDADPNGTLGDFTATIDWGDGQTSAGTIANGPTGNFLVNGSHTYLEEGNYAVSVVIAEAGGASAPASSSAAVADAALTAFGASVSGAEGAALSGVVASFTDADPNGALGDYTATIDWGDGQTSPGTITAGPAGNFLVSGSHTYAEEGPNTVSVQIVDAGGSMITATSSAVVGDAALNVQGMNVSAMEGSTFSGEVGTFTDANAYALTSEFTVSIDWGDTTS
jgi:hypothetical protein